jgi:hypothetical protein
MFVAGDARDATIAVAAKKQRKKRPLLLRSASEPVLANANAQLVLQPTKFARGLLRERKKLKGGIKLTFTPDGGSPSSQTLAVTLRR